MESREGLVSNDAPLTLLGALQKVEEEVVGQVVPAERAVLLSSVSRAARAAMKRVLPPPEKSSAGLF